MKSIKTILREALVKKHIPINWDNGITAFSIDDLKNSSSKKPIKLFTNTKLYISQSTLTDEETKIAYDNLQEIFSYIRDNNKSINNIVYIEVARDTRYLKIFKIRFYNSKKIICACEYKNANWVWLNASWKQITKEEAYNLITK